MNCLLHYHHEAHVSHIVTVCHVVIVIFIVHCWNQIGRTNFWRHDMADCWYERCWQSFNVLLTAYWQRCQTESVNVARGQGWKIKTTNREDRRFLSANRLRLRSAKTRIFGTSRMTPWHLLRRVQVQPLYWWRPSTDKTTPQCGTSSKRGQAVVTQWWYM